MRSCSVALRDTRGQLSATSPDPWIDSSKDIVQRFVDVLLISEHYSLYTCTDYRAQLMNVDRWLQRCEGCSIVTADDEQLIRYLSDWIGRRTSMRKLPRVLLSLRRFYAFLCDTHARDDNPMMTSSIRRWDEQQRPRSVRLRRQRESSWAVQQRDRVMLALMIAGGLKPAQLIALELGDLHLDRGVISLGARPVAREMRISSELAEMLKRFLLAPRQTLLRGRDGTHVFPACGGRRLTAQEFWHAFRRRAEVAPSRSAYGASNGAAAVLEQQA